MKVAFFSNYLTHFQLPLCDAFYNNPEIEFTFVAFETLSEERKSMCIDDLNEKYPYVLCAYKSEENEVKAQTIAKTFDVVIIGNASNKYLDLRMKENLLTFKYCERPLKKGKWRRFIPRTHKKIHDGFIQYKDKNFYVLGSSAYTASDLELCGFNKDKCFKWGYFPKVNEYDLQSLLKDKEENSLMWCARLIKLKHPETFIYVAKKLKKQGYNFHINVVGNGILQKEYEERIRKNKLENEISILGAMPTEEVREKMEKTKIFFFTSDRREGWGAVINESMNCACAVVSSNMAGVTNFLVENGKNGFIYKSGNKRDLYKKIKLLLDNKELAEEFGKNAYRTMVNMWNADNAVDRFIKLVKAINDGQDYKTLFLDGVCSLSE